MRTTSGATDEWRRIAKGSSDVLYDILSWPDKKHSWREDEFYATGVSDWADFVRHWDHFWPERGGTCLEVGCGAGRITSPLARSFDSVVAVDVSSHMIERAQRVAPDNVRFCQGDGAMIPVEDCAVDAVFSVHVMQHLESRSALVTYIGEMRRVLRHGGSLMVHIPLRGAPRGGRLGGRISAVRSELALWRSRRELRQGKEHSSMRVRTYWLNDVWQMLVDAGFAGIELRMIPVRSNGFGHQFWLARAK